MCQRPGANTSGLEGAHIFESRSGSHRHRHRSVLTSAGGATGDYPWGSGGLATRAPEPSRDSREGIVAYASHGEEVSGEPALRRSFGV